MATVQTLKDKNNDTFYPVTKTEAVYNADGSETLDNTLNTKATISTSAGDANKMMKADGTKALVTSDNIDFTTSDDIGSITFETGYSAATANSFLKKFGDMVFWQIALVRTSAYPTSATTVATLPSSFRPIKNSLGWGFTSGGDPIYALVSSEGAVRTACKTALATTTNVYLGGVFWTS